MTEPFDIKKFFDLSPTALGKSLSIGWKVVLIALVIFFVYRGITANRQKQTQQITVESGGQATIIQKQTSKRFLIPFIECSVGQSNRYDKLETAVKGGIRVEF